ncbi:hypothetical protein [Ruminococcus flavefaciens]|uniref:hypothetical protein n=1 Tax=Ruminococcus flavefaciens TaxID=1265 RepID=UPI0013D9D637|nr:hypothetical protein [Ruminococcus flavefaciens]
MEHKISATLTLSDDNIKELDRRFAISAFNATNGSRYIACVGENGDYGLDTIFDGFAETVQSLITSIGEGKNCADPLVYPILYCVRHSIELFLKMSYEMIFVIKGIKSNKSTFKKIRDISLKIELLEKDKRDPFFTTTDEECELVKQQNQNIDETITLLSSQIDSCWDKILCNKENQMTHNLKSLHENIIAIYKVDERIQIEYDFIVRYLTDYLERDPNGDMYRYLVNDHNKRHFVSNGIQTVDLLKIGEQFVCLKALFEDFLKNLSSIHSEYSTLTYTSKLSRKQLEDISHLVPKPENFNAMIASFRTQIMSKYQLSKSDFDKALRIIREHNEFSWNIGKELLCQKIRPEVLELIKECARDEKEWEDSYKFLSKDEFYSVLAFKELGRYPNQYYSEDYSIIVRDFQNRQLDKYALKPSVDLKYVISGMKMCGQHSYAEILETQ